MVFENRYSLLDRTLHRIAFHTCSAQVALADAEDRLFAKKLAGIKLEKPVFITALPRAGTTLILAFCATLEEFSAHCYRDMPFVLTPLLWRNFSTRFHQKTLSRERAHGDGMQVNVDSPEAFEEVIWKFFWKTHYKKNAIVPWGKESNPDFFDFFQSHMRKMLALHGHQTALSPRYLSKNNLNIARLDYLSHYFPDACILVPFRHPVQHAASLLRQHLNFLEIHRQDRFARDYMAAIGHYDFGENLRPINFKHWVDTTPYSDPTTLSYWLAYWIAAYSNILTKINTRVQLLSYETFCERPQPILEQIATFLDIKAKETFYQQAHQINALKHHTIDTETVPTDLLNNAQHLYDDLNRAALA